MLLRVVVFYVLTFVLTFIIGGIQETTGLSPEILILPQCAPGLAALLMLLVFRKDGHRISIFDHKVPASRYIFAALVPVGGALAIYLINSLMLHAIDFGDLTGIPWFLLIWMPVGAFGEELGWRGYLHKRFGNRLTGVSSSLIVGILWASWHVGSYQNGILYMTFFILSTVSYTFMMYALVADVGFNVLVTAVFHLMINIVNLFSYSIINDMDFMLVNGLVWAAVAVGEALIKKPCF